MKGFVITTAGETMLARAAAGETLTITQVAVGKGVVASLEAAKALTALVDQVALGTSSAATAAGSQVSMTVEYRNDMGGGLETGFTLSEFGIFASVGDDTAQLLYYASLGDDAAPVQPISDGLDVHRYPVAIAVTGDVTVTLAYPPGGFVLETRKINDKPLSADVTLTGADIAVSASDATKIAAALSNKAAIYLGEAGSDLLQWAAAQTSSGGFTVPPDGAQINNPAPGNWLWGYIEKSAPNRTIVRVIVDATGIEYVNHVINDVWFGWRQYATATPPQEYDLPLAGATGTCKYSLDQFGMVRIAGLVTRDVETVYFGTLPEGYRPADQIVFSSCGFTDGNTISPCTVGVDADGRVWVNDFGSEVTKVPVNMCFAIQQT